MKITSPFEAVRVSVPLALRAPHSPSLITASVLLALAASAQAQTKTGDPQLQDYVVTATRSLEPLSDLVSDMSIIDRDTISNSGATGLAELLAQVPGIEMTRTGGLGSAATVYLRGAETRFTAVFIDGVRIDSQGTGGADWEQIPLGLIDHIEILRGPAAAIYGSDAVAGVVQIFTKRGEGPFQPWVNVGVGSYRGLHADAGFSGSQNGFDYALGVQHEQSKSFPALTQPGLDASKFGYINNSTTARLGYQFTPDQRLEATLLASDQTKGYVNTYDGPNYDQIGYAQTQELLNVFGLNWYARWNANYSTQLSYSDSLDHNASGPVTLAPPNDQFVADTHERNFLFLNDWKQGMHHFTLALERREDSLLNNDFFGDPVLNMSRFQNGIALGYELHWQQHTLQLNARHDDYSAFGGHNTGSLAYGYAITPSWRFTASTGVAYRAPTLFQQFSSYGTPNLKPETSHNLELGLKYAQGSSRFSVVAYDNRVTNLIQFSPDYSCVTNCYLNLGNARMPGVTFSGERQVGSVKLHGSLDLQNPVEVDTNTQLPRRARQHGVLGAETRLSAWALGLDAQFSGARPDVYPVSTMLAGYTLWNAHATTALSPQWQLLLRLDNLTNKNYQLIESYATAGRTVYVGLKWTPQNPR